MKGLEKLLGGLLGRMKDDKGLFQGGKQGQTFGRIKDILGVSPKNQYGDRESYDPSMEDSRVVSQHARDFAKNMDVGNKEDVFELQSMLSHLGIGDYEGKSLKADGILGDRTLSAMRILQGGSNDEQQGPGPWAYGDEGSSPRSWVDKLFGGASRDARKARNSLFERTYDTSPDAYKQGGSLMWKRKQNDEAGPGY